MTTAGYETIPSEKITELIFYEIQQSMRGEPLTRHPETGELIRRIILGGYGAVTKTEPSGGKACGPGCC